MKISERLFVLFKAFQNFVDTYYEQRRPVIPMLSAMRRSTKPSEEQMELRKAWDTLEERVNSVTKMWDQKSGHYDSSENLCILFQQKCE